MPLRIELKVTIKFILIKIRIAQKRQLKKSAIIHISYLTTVLVVTLGNDKKYNIVKDLSSFYTFV